MKKLSFLLVILIFFFSACGTTNQNESNTVEKNQKGEGDVSLLTEANNQLAFNLLSKTKELEEDNIFLSPASLYIALSLIYNGADGETKKEMEKLLNFSDAEALNQASKDFYQALTKSKEGITLHIANSLWLNDLYSFQDNFQENMESFYDAKISEVDISSPETPGMINAWVEDNTKGRIKDIVKPPLPPETIAFLINAIYLKADWKHSFDPSETRLDDFHLTDGTTKKVEMMTLMDELEYLENERFQAVTLPYGDGAMSMQIFLPKEGVEFSDEFTFDNWKKWNDRFLKQEGRVYLPSFELEFEVTLKKILQSLGMTTAFSEKEADFSKMVNETDEVFIHEVKQKTFLLVDEEGTEAAGVTSVEMRTTSMVVDGPFEMKINRPFYLVIKDEETGAILFIGEITDPPKRS